MAAAKTSVQVCAGWIGVDREGLRTEVATFREQCLRDWIGDHGDSIKIRKEPLAIRKLLCVFEAVLAISREKGFPAMSVRDLARETGFSMGALYSYFPSKEILLDMMQDMGRRMILGILQGRIEQEQEPPAKLRRAIETHLALSEVLQPWFYFAYMEAKNMSRERQRQAMEDEKATEGLFVDILDRGVVAGYFRDVPRERTAGAIKALLQDWYLKPWKHQQRPGSSEDYGYFLWCFVEAYVRP